ncbi:MerR family transcriptional regulator, partial [Burkholderia cenocepacia]
MGTAPPRLNASAAAARLGVSIKALRLYERRGLITPERTPAG